MLIAGHGSSIKACLEMYVPVAGGWLQLLTHRTHRELSNAPQGVVWGDLYCLEGFVGSGAGVATGDKELEGAGSQ